MDEIVKRRGDANEKSRKKEIYATSPNPSLLRPAGDVRLCGHLSVGLWLATGRPGFRTIVLLLLTPKQYD
jgi:hypothetical protein